MNLQKFYQLRDSIETFSFEKNFKPLSNTLYYFSFLGNIFLILLSYFFIKDVTKDIPVLFSFQDILFSSFIILFMTGYELFKRFSFEQLTVSLLRLRSFTTNIFIGSIVSIILVVGSFYLALNGAHRLVDNSFTVTAVSDSVIRKETDSVFYYYDKQIKLNESQIQKLYENDGDGILGPRAKESLSTFDSNIKRLEDAKSKSIKAIEQRYNNKTDKALERTSQNNIAFIFITFSLELIILIGVGFSSYYKWNTFNDMKRILSDPKFKKVELNTNLLKLYFQNGRKKEGDPVVPTTRFRDLVSNSKNKITYKEVSEFVSLCEELEIITGKKKNKTYNASFEKAHELIQAQELH